MAKHRYLKCNHCKERKPRGLFKEDKFGDFKRICTPCEKDIEKISKIITPWGYRPSRDFDYGNIVYTDAVIPTKMVRIVR